jgi:2-polyprenyl-3-methyl-5-hydroxy-6-metoxy-1,4-benzoquinol methylase
MDEPDLDPEDLRTALDDLARVNRWLGGWRVLRQRFGAMLLRLPRGSYTVLDVGTGGADLPLRLRDWAGRRGYRLEILATDLHPQTVEVARTRVAGIAGIRVDRADAAELPFGDAAFDFALCSTLLHHFPPGEALRVVRELARVSRIGFVVNDLRRTHAAHLGARLLAATVWRRSRFTRHDGPLSVRKAFTVDELRAIAELAGIAGAEVRAHVPFRLSLSVNARAAAHG